MSFPALHLSGVVKRYTGHTAVAGIDVQVQPGEVVALLGPNGAGKSTTLAISAGLVLPDSGQVRVSGEVVHPGAVSVRRRVGYLPDVDGLFPRLTGWEHLELTARVHGLERDWVPTARELVERLGLVAAAGRRAGGYSHGMGRKLSLAVALLPRPDLLLLDEPFDGVDPAGSVVVRELVTAASRRGAGVLISTHLLDVADRLADRLVVIRAGRVVADATPASLRAALRDDDAAPVGGDDALESVYLGLMAAAGDPLTSAG